MTNNSPFRIQGSTQTITAAVAAPTAVQLIGDPTGEMTINIANVGTVWCFFGFGATAALALANAVIPTVGVPSTAQPIPPNTMVAYTIPANSFVTAVATSTTAALYYTPGYGL